MHRTIVAAAILAALGAQAGAQENPIQSLFSQSLQPQGNPRDDPARRRIVVPAIRAATNCIARETLNEGGVVEAYARGDLQSVIASAASRCSGDLRFMISEQDRVYGQGSGRGFYEGPYRDDLPRAVLTRIRPELDQRRANFERLQAEARADADRRVADARVENERREAQRRLDADKAESEHRAELLTQEDLKRQRLDAAERATALLKDRMYDCVGREMRDLVKSGEGAEVLATATMTLCSSEIDRLLDGFIEAKKIETGAAYVGEAEKSALKTVGRDKVREQVVASAVKAKAAKASGSSF